MKNLTLENIAKACNGSYHGSEAQANQEVQSIFTDSRKAAKGGLFVPIKGARVDAHDFINQVMEAGALATLSEKDLGETEFPYIKVESSLQAVKDIAGILFKTVRDSGCRNYRKCWKNKYERNDCSSTWTEI